VGVVDLMRHTLKKWCVHLFWAIVHPLRRAYWFAVRPTTTGVKCLIENDGAFLLVRINYAHRLWSICGGGIKRNESPEHAAVREAREETGLAVSRVSKLGEYDRRYEYKIDHVHVFHAYAETRAFAVDGIEVSEADWFTLNALPKDRVPSVEQIIGMYKNRGK
jgi:8-oxo-dGTP pyrophosphatase MutT (NUDIX family)